VFDGPVGGRRCHATVLGCRPAQKNRLQMGSLTEINSVFDYRGAIRVMDRRYTPYHAILRAGLKALLELESDVVIVGEFDCVESALKGSFASGRM
jgi:hypothetical protein